MYNVCVFCSSNLGDKPEYAKVATELGQLIAKQGFGMIYGGANVGLMRYCAEAAIQGGAEVTGVITTFLAQKHLTQHGLKELIVVETMQERKAKMAELADAFVIMPGGFGTLEETFEVLTAAQLGFHKKPVVFLNTLNFYCFLQQQLNHMVSSKMLLEPHSAMAQFANTPQEVFALLKSYKAPVIEKWIDDIRRDNGHNV